MEARKHPRPGTPPICSRQRWARQIEFSFEGQVAPPFPPIAPSFLPRRARRIRAAAVSPQGPRATLRMLAGASRDSFSRRVSLEKESASHLAIFHELAGTLPVQATKQVFPLRFAATRSSQRERRRPQAPWLPDPMWQSRRSLLRTIGGPKRSDKMTSTENYARSGRTSRWARGYKGSFESGRLRQPPAPEDRIVRKCAPRQNSAVVLCNIA